jgi:hypothetical protein
MGSEGAGERGLQALQLPTQAGNDRHPGRHHLAVGSSHYRRRLQLLARQGGLDTGSAGLDLPAPARPTQCRHQLGMRQRPAQLRGRGQLQDSDRIPTTGITSEGGQGCRIEGPQGAAYDVGLPSMSPDQLLVPRASTLTASASPESPATWR